MELHRPDATRPVPRTFRRLVAVVLLLLSALFAIGAERRASEASELAGAASVPQGGDRVSRSPSERDKGNGIQVVQVKGLLDPPNVSLLRDTIRRANRADRSLMLIQLDSDGAITDVHQVVRAISRSHVPIVVWVGPSGAEAKGGAALIAAAAHALFLANGSTVGPVRPVRLDRDDAASPGKVTIHVDGHRPTVGETIVKLDGKTVATAAGERTLDTARVVGEGRDRRRQPNQQVVFATLGLGGQVQHSLINPSIAYFLFVIGLALIVFEFFAASIGFAAAVGALAVIGACYGFSHLPVHWWALGLLLLSALGFAIDAQAGGLGFWTAVGVLTLLGGSLTLLGGSAELRPEWWVLVTVIATAILFYAFAIPTFIRARFSTPTVGREGMLGELGTAEVAVNPDGVVVIRGARWRARTNRATPIEAGDTVRVVAIEGVVLEVEPEAGGARDYRERGRRKQGTDSTS